MSSFWDSIADRTVEKYTVDDFESAAYRLVVEQVLYYADRHSRVAYYIVEQYERDFRQALAPLGINLQVNRILRYACALPQHAKAGTASTAQTVMALVLRMIYDEGARVGQQSDDGEILVDLVELEVKYREMTGREFPTKGKLDAILEVMKRWGIVRVSLEHPVDDGDNNLETQPYMVIIRPAITDLLGETALQRLSRFKMEDPSDTDDDAGGAVDELADQGTEA